MILYKYRQDNDNTVKIFTSKKIWLSTPAKLNDPFESALQPIDDEFRVTKVREMKQAQLMGFILTAKSALSSGNFFGLTKIEIGELIDQFKKLKNPEESYKFYSDFITNRIGNPPSDSEALFSKLQEQISAVGIFSLSEVADDPLMWSHYAEDHKGICLGFEVTDGSVLANNEHFLKVTYSNSIPSMTKGFKSQLHISFDEKGRLKTTSQIAFSDPTVQAAISTKGCEWEYEREWRYVEPVSGSYNWPGPIVEIIFGLNCSKERRDHYFNLVENFIPNDVRFYEIQRIPGTRSVQRIRVALPFEKRSVRDTIPSLSEVKRLLEARKYLDVLPMVEQLLKNTPNSAELFFIKGVALGLFGDHLDALECFERATWLDPKYSSAWYHKGVALTELEHFNDAIDAYLEAQKLGLEDPSVSYNLGSVLTHVKRYDEALTQLKIAKTLRHPRAANLLREVEIAHKLSRFPTA